MFLNCLQCLSDSCVLCLDTLYESFCLFRSIDVLLLYLRAKHKFLSVREVEGKMGKITRFDIVFSNPSNAYYSGQTISGKVVVEITESMKIRGNQ